MRPGPAGWHRGGSGLVKQHVDRCAPVERYDAGAWGDRAVVLLCDLRVSGLSRRPDRVCVRVPVCAVPSTGVVCVFVFVVPLLRAVSH